MLARDLVLSSPEVASDLLGLEEDSLEDSAFTLISEFYIETENERNMRRCYRVSRNLTVWLFLGPKRELFLRRTDL